MKRPTSLPIAPAMLREQELRARFLDVRGRTEALAAPITTEDAQVQSMPDVSPAKWHLAHTSWFFETFVLRTHEPGFAPFDPDFHYLFNSYYEAEGVRHPRSRRGMITRPGLARVMAWRKNATERVSELLPTLAVRDDWPDVAALIELGCHHEEQHQELMLTDIKHVLAQNPLAPAYKASYPKPMRTAPEMRFHAFEEGLREIGHAGSGFAFDNETPRHRRFVHGFALASRPVTNGEFVAFIEDGGYDEPRHWLSDGRAWLGATGRRAPLYWEWRDGAWWIFTLYGRQPIHPEEPVAHLSHYEADAFAAWAGARLPREEELEIALAAEPAADDVNDLGSGRLHPAVAREPAGGRRFVQLAGDVWEWTLSAHAPFPGYRPAPGAVGEYNGKFMCGQQVLKGGSCLTPPGHWRASYRNFFPPAAAWQMSGLRLARDL